MTIGHMIERRRRGRNIAWGVSPRMKDRLILPALEGRQIAAAA